MQSFCIERRMYDQSILVRKRGVVTIPREIRVALGLKEGDILRASVDLNGRIVLEVIG